MKTPDIYITTPHSLLLQWEQHISVQIENNILQAINVLQTHFSEEIIEMVPSYNELAIYLESTVVVDSIKLQILSELHRSEEPFKELKRRHLKIPVCYHVSVAPDLENVAAFHKMPVAQLVKLHSSPTYRVSFLGFLPGFPYLSGLPERLHTPRKETPSTRIEAGSVGIGGKQTGIYTQNSPGGWHIIGRSPLQFFDVARKEPSLIQAGDMITFSAVDQTEFENIATAVKNETYILKTEPYD